MVQSSQHAREAGCDNQAAGSDKLVAQQNIIVGRRGLSWLRIDPQPVTRDRYHAGRERENSAISIDASYSRSIVE